MQELDSSGRIVPFILGLYSRFCQKRHYKDRRTAGYWQIKRHKSADIFPKRHNSAAFDKRTYQNKKVMETISARIVRIQEDSGKNKIDFAASIDVSVRTLRSWLNNAISPSIEALQTIVARYDVDANWLLNGEGPVYRNADAPKPSEQVADTNVNILSFQSKNNVKNESQDVARLLAQIESLQDTIRSLTSTNQALTERLLIKNA